MMKFEGVIPALATPLTEEEHVNVPVLRALIERLLAEGADGFYIGGATGEGLALRTEERMILAEEAIRCVGGRKPCIVQVAAADFRDAQALARHAERVGAAAVSATAPMFFQYDADDVYGYYKRLAGCSGIPMMVYYNPAAGFPIDAGFAARLFEIDNVSAIKWTSADYYGMIRAKDLTHGEMNILNGADEMLLMGLAAGADGGIGTTYNFMLPRIREIYDCFRAGDIAGAQRAQTAADRVIAVLLRYKIIPAAKAALEAKGFAVGNASFPMKRYSDEQKAVLVHEMREAGLEL